MRNDERDQTLGLGFGGCLMLLAQGQWPSGGSGPGSRKGPGAALARPGPCFFVRLPR